MLVAVRLFCVLGTFGFASLVGAQGSQDSDLTQLRPLVPNNRWAVVIGVSSYSEDVGALKYTAKEAREFSSLLTDGLKFEPDNVRLLADGGTPEEVPTSAHILASLDGLLNDKRLDKANLFVFYFSGHGVGTASGDYLLPADSKKGQFESMGVPVKEVIARIVNAGLKNVVFIADACRAGTENPFGTELNALCRKANIAVILGCAPGKRSYEYPTLKQGAFTHFLMQALSDKTLRDQSGTLWASAVGADVQKRVHDYTEIDHGKYAQVPALWGDQSTLDVLLATYPQPPVSDAAIATFKRTAEKLDKRDYGTALTNFAFELEDAERYDECVNLLKTVEQLGESTPLSRLILAGALSQLGRIGEATRVYDTFDGDPDGFWKDLALCCNSSRSVDPRLKTRAAFRLFDSDNVWMNKFLAWQVVDTCGSTEDKLRLARRFAGLVEKDERKHQFAVSQLADTEGRWKDAVAALDQAMTSPGDAPSNDLLLLTKLRPVVELGDPATIDAYVEDGLKNEKYGGFFYLQKAQLAKNRGDDKARIECLRQALARELSPDSLWLVLKIAGAHVDDIKVELKASALKHPYSWRARLVVAFIRWAEGDVKKALEDLGNTDRYVDDLLTFKSKVFELTESILAEEVQLNQIDLGTYLAQLDFYFLVLRGFASEFGYDEDLWWQLVRYGLVNERTAQVTAVTTKYLKLTPEDVPRPLRSLIVLLAANRGDVRIADRFFRSQFAPTEKSDPGWIYAFFEATRDQTDRARKLVPELGPPSPDLAERTDAFKTYLLAKGGKGDEARQQLEKFSDDTIVRAFQGLAWAELGEWGKAEPLLLEQVGKRVWAMLFVQEYAMRRLDERYRSTGRLELAQNIALTASVSQVGNPLFEQYSYVEKPGVAQFEGAVELKAVAMPDKVEGLTDTEGSLQFKVSSSGVFSGKFIEDGGKEHVFEGKIDGLGNLDGVGDWNGHSLRLSGKIAPPGLYRTFAGFESVGQILQLVDDDGFRIAILGRTKPGPRSRT